MDEQTKRKILDTVLEFFREKFVKSHISKIEELKYLRSFDYNAFYINYLSNFLTGNDSPRNLAKALIYPRILGTSPNTIFGDVTQKFCSTLKGVLGSMTAGVDIEFMDQIDKRRKFAQLKLGVNTINSKDVDPMIKEFQAAKRLALTNNRQVTESDFIVGILFGSHDRISHSYKAIEKHYPIFTGEDFWLRLTGDESFYNKLVDELGKIAKEANATDKLEVAIDALAEDIELAIKSNKF